MTQPTITCIMPTRNRRRFIPGSIACFLAQDYPQRELIIVDDGDEVISDLIPDDVRVRYIRLHRPHTTGSKRNLACAQADGLIIANWDDDDYYAPHRLRYQAEALLGGAGDCSGLAMDRIVDVARWQGWRHSLPGDRTLSVFELAIGPTLMYWRWVWEYMARFPDSSMGEDVAFLEHARRKGIQLVAQAHGDSFVYVRHSHNTWQFIPDQLLGADAWACVPPEDLLPPQVCARLHETIMMG